MSEDVGSSGRIVGRGLVGGVRARAGARASVNFVSWAFVALFARVLVARLTIGRRKIEPAYVASLLVSSLVFYAWHVPVYLGILLFSSGIDYAAGLWLARIPLDHHRASTARPGPVARHQPRPARVLQVRRLLRSGRERSRSARCRGPALAGVRAGPADGHQLLHVPVDVLHHRRVSRAPGAGPRFAAFLLFISFFPQLVAGPIVRAVEFLPQMPRPAATAPAGRSTRALWLIIERLLPEDGVRRQPGRLRGRALGAGPPSRIGQRGFALWLALMFSGQIFADFAGYSNIARGTAYLLGYRLPVNFNAPYIAGVVQELLGALAHHAVAMAARLPVRPARRQPAGRGTDLRQPAAGDGARRTVARRGLHLHRLGRAARRRPWPSNALLGLHQRSRVGAILPRCGRHGSSSCRASC